MTSSDFKKIIYRKQKEFYQYFVTFATIDGGKAAIEMDLNDAGAIEDANIIKIEQSELVDQFWQDINTRFDVIEYLRALGAIKK